MITTPMAIAAYVALVLVFVVIQLPRLRRGRRRARLMKLRAAARLRAAGDYDQAERHILDVLAHRRGRQPGDIEITLLAGQLLANGRTLRGQLVEAEADLTALLDDYGPHHYPHLPRAWQTAARLALVYAVRGRYTEAITIASQVADELTRRTGAESAWVLDARHRLGWCLWRAKRPEEAVAVLTEVVTTRRRLTGSTKGRTTLAAARLGLGQLDEAEPVFHAVLAEPRNAVEAISARFALAKIAALRGRREMAVAGFTEVLQQARTQLGADAPVALDTRYELAELDDGPEALTAHQAVLADRIRVLGPDHPDTQLSRDAVAEYG